MLDLVCYAHLPWDFVYQRPQHLMRRCAQERRVFYVEPPHFDAQEPHLEVTTRGDGLSVATPHLPQALEPSQLVRAFAEEAVAAAMRRLLDHLLATHARGPIIAWYYTPMALIPTQHLHPLVTVYDCMDELSAFADGPPELPALERALLDRADLVFTGGHSLYAAKRTLHPHVYAFPSAVDVPHFAQARQPQPDPPDQADIPHPRLGFAGVLDERLDRELVAAVAAQHPAWQWVFVGPVASQKFDPALLPQGPNIHYLGLKPYAALPAYLAGWEVATLPFARTAATRYLSPTKTPEYLAAGRPVVSTSLADVVQPYGAQGLVHIADTPLAFSRAVERALAEDAATRWARVDPFLATLSWDRTWAGIARLLAPVMAERLGEGEQVGS